LSPNHEEKIKESLDTLTLPDPLELMGLEFKKVAIIGVGLIGGSIGLRMRAMDYPGMIIGYDLPEVLDEALMRGAIDRGVGDLSEAVADADLIVLAMTVDQIVRLLPTVLRQARQGAVVTDSGPSKVDLDKIAAETPDCRAIYVGGHPMAGSNRQGITNAHAEMFVSAYWLLCPHEDTPKESLDSLKWWVRTLGAYPIGLDAVTHDRIMAMTTHMPFVLSLALSDFVSEHSADIPLLQKLATGNFQMMTSTAALPLEMWEAVIESNRENLVKALDDFRKALKECEELVRTGRLATLWQRAHSFHQRLARERPGDWDAQTELSVIAPDRPGTIARIAGLLAGHGINIRDIGLLHVRERVGGVLRVTLESRADVHSAIQVLNDHGFKASVKR
jgi:prephenate dehydrogenase